MRPAISAESRGAHGKPRPHRLPNLTSAKALTPENAVVARLIWPMYPVATTIDNAVIAPIAVMTMARRQRLGPNHIPIAPTMPATITIAADRRGMCGEGNRTEPSVPLAGSDPARNASTARMTTTGTPSCKSTCGSHR